VKRQRKRTAAPSRGGPRSQLVFALGALGRFLTKNGWTPSAPQLTEFTRYRSRWWWWRQLRALERAELVFPKHRRWMLTDFGADYLGIGPVVARRGREPTAKARKQRVREARGLALRRRLAAHVVYEQPPFVGASWLADQGLPSWGGLPIVE